MWGVIMSILRMRREEGGWSVRGWSLRETFMVEGWLVGWCQEGVGHDG